ncbi:hypothetical protein PVAND_002398 [Polypedilum vanderplanki]|uniref:Uncharacterized protein n=1 Tax=Polypedilum vanderplanki TaxID=319348 RepID=A0A9J6BQV2_POLVA|nr:hypothetical protein PVAND_002398 [Polypedilum vanderplanki]
MDKIPMQTLQIYRKSNVISSDVRFKKIEEELRQVRIKYPMPPAIRHPEKASEKIDLGEPPKIKSIELQNKLRRIENQLNFWVSEYRGLIEDLLQVEKLLPKSNHSLNESDELALDNVHKIVKIEEMREKILDEYKNLSIRFEELSDKTKKQIRKLEDELSDSQAKAECLEFEVKKLKKHAK